MMFWFAAAALAAAVTYAVTLPLARETRDGGDDSAAADLAVYKDQLKEIEADIARGALSGSEAEAARAEVARRMLRKSESAARVSSPDVAAARSKFARLVYTAASIALPLASVALYLTYGAPGLPGQPLSARLEMPNDVAHGEDLVAKVEAALRINPEDGKGWDVIAPVYLAQARYVDAANAYATSMRLLGENFSRLLGFALARIHAENGLAPDDARKALEAARKLEPQRTEPRVWLALAKEQDGDVTSAAAEYRAILAGSAADAPWRKSVEERLASLDGGAAAGSRDGRESAAGAGPSAADVAAIEAMTPEQRAAKINDMVDGLAAKLKAQPNDLAGWQKLIRSYTALGRRDDAMKAAAAARAGLSGDAAQVQQLDAWIKDLGLAG
ncbi:MAG: c-type cytochrome biogenesis protein CcmI [Hyphomicrobium sp.]